MQDKRLEEKGKEKFSSEKPVHIAAEQARSCKKQQSNIPFYLGKEGWEV